MVMEVDCLRPIRLRQIKQCYQLRDNTATLAAQLCLVDALKLKADNSCGA